MPKSAYKDAILNKLDNIRYSEKLTPYWLLLPFLVAVLAFKAFPTLWAPWMATQEYSLVGTEFVGLANYVDLWEREVFFDSLRVTFIITAIRAPISIGFGLAAALAVNSLFIKYKSIWRTLYIAPIVVAPVIVAIILRMFLEPYAILDLITLNVFDFRIQWLNSPLPAQLSVALAGAYVSIAVNFIFFLAGLVGVDQSLYRAAKVDGANKLQQFRHVTIPQLRPIIVMVTILETNRALKVFAEPQVLTNGGEPGGATRTVVVLLYREAFVNLNLGFSAAIGLALTVIIATLMLIEYRIGQGPET